MKANKIVMLGLAALLGSTVYVQYMETSVS